MQAKNDSNIRLIIMKKFNLLNKDASDLKNICINCNNLNNYKYKT